MKDHPGGSNARRPLLMAAVVFALGAAAWAANFEYIHEDLRLSGKEITSFQDANQDVIVVSGNFKVTVGKRVVSGQDAVIWINTTHVGSVPRHDVEIYAEGGVSVLDAGTSTTDKTMFVTLHCDGRVRAAGKIVQADVQEGPLYQRAVEARRQAQAPPPSLAEVRAQAAAAASAPAEDETAAAPREIVTWAPTSPPGPMQTMTPVKKSPPPPPAAQVAAGGRLAQGATRPATQPVRVAAKKPVKQPQPRVLDYSYEEGLSSQEVELRPGEGLRRVTILRGRVRLGMGDPKSDQYLELRSDAAVLISRKNTATTKPTGKKAGSAIGPGVGRLGGSGGETFDGVYLEGDVVISRGERTFRAPRAYYDLGTDRATILEPVFTSVQEPRNIPIYIRAREAHVLSTKEVVFDDAKVSSSELYTPSYHIGAETVDLKDKTPYDEEGVRTGPTKYEATMKHTTANVQGVPLFYWPYQKTDLTEGSSALRSAKFGKEGNLGFGVMTDWNFFRLLGLVPPEGFKATLGLNWFKQGAQANLDLDYARSDYSGYAKAYGMIDRKGEDTFGNEIKDVPAPEDRGWLLWRHKQVLPQGWELQLEASYVSDANFLRAFYPTEYYAGKPQETLMYVKKQQDNWDVSGLLQYRLNNFQTQTESWPELAFHMIGQPLLGDRLTFFTEDRAGVKRWMPGDDTDEDSSNYMGRLDSRNELDFPAHLGPVNLLTYAVGRATYWGDVPESSDKHFRPYGQVGQRASMDIWRVYDNVESRTWDIRRLKHVITPQVTAFASDTGGVEPDDLFPMNPDIEEHLLQTGGGSVGVLQRLQTKRGPGGADERTVDWMRFNLIASFFTKDDPNMASNGQFFWYRPEYSILRDNVSAEYDWQVSDSTAFLSDLNYDIKDGSVAKADAGLAIARDPRVRYYLGWRYINELDSSLGIFGVNYKLSRKYTLSVFEQYDFRFKNGQNEATNVALIRQFNRYYVAGTFTYVQGRATSGNFGLAIWLEGVPEALLGNNNLNMLGSSDRN
ncbi:MAG: LPS assembly protein LptD [Phycisphaerae bacterium]|jgi:hypothetical protein